MYILIYIHVVTLETLSSGPSTPSFNFRQHRERFFRLGCTASARVYGDQDLPIDRSADRRPDRGFDIRFSFFVCTLLSRVTSNVYNFLRSTEMWGGGRRGGGWREEAAAASEGVCRKDRFRFYKDVKKKRRASSGSSSKSEGDSSPHPGIGAAETKGDVKM